MLLQSIKKEFILVFNDLHSIAVLLLMPVIFMLIMTIAMSERQSDVIKNQPIKVEHTNEFEQTLLLGYFAKFGYQLNSIEQDASASIELTSELKTKLFSNNKVELMHISFAAKTSPPVQALLKQHLQMAFARLKLHLFMLDSGELDENLSLEQQMAQIEQQTDTSGYIAVDNQQQQLPVISYSIPSWLIFGVYFIVMPISLTLLNEVKNGTLIRLKTFPLNLQYYFLLKLLAFYLISLGQFLILSLIGWRVIPLLIDLPPIPYTQIGALLSSGLIVSFAAVSFASIIATLVRSFEQAIVLGGGLNIIMAALSGFMVPLDIMPQALQKIAHFSPMYWSAELVKDAIYGELNQDYYLSVAYLTLFAAFSLSLSGLLFSRRIRSLSWN